MNRLGASVSGTWSIGILSNGRDFADRQFGSPPVDAIVYRVANHLGCYNQRLILYVITRIGQIHKKAANSRKAAVPWCKKKAKHRRITAGMAKKPCRPYSFQIFPRQSFGLSYSFLRIHRIFPARTGKRGQETRLATTTRRPFSWVYSQVDRVMSISPYSASTPVS